MLRLTDNDIKIFHSEINKDISEISISITMHEDGQMETKTIPTYGLWLIDYGWCCDRGGFETFLTTDLNSAYMFRQEMSTAFPKETYEVREYS